MKGRGVTARALIALGGVALLAAVGVDALAVLGRHAGLPLLGSIELVQVAVFVSGSVALLLATIDEQHARVHLLTDRVPLRLRALLLRGGLLLGAVLFTALLAASVWIALDLWGGHEQSELLRLPFRPLRVFAIVATAAIAVTFWVQAVRAGRR